MIPSERPDEAFTRPRADRYCSQDPEIQLSFPSNKLLVNVHPYISTVLLIEMVLTGDIEKFNKDGNAETSDRSVVIQISTRTLGELYD